MKIGIHRNETSQPLVYENVINAYTKGNMYCILVKEDDILKVYKFPLCSIFRVVEEYK